MIIIEQQGQQELWCNVQFERLRIAGSNIGFTKVKAQVVPILYYQFRSTHLKITANESLVSDHVDLLVSFKYLRHAIVLILTQIHYTDSIFVRLEVMCMRQRSRNHMKGALELTQFWLTRWCHSIVA